MATSSSDNQNIAGSHAPKHEVRKRGKNELNFYKEHTEITKIMIINEDGPRANTETAISM